MHTPREPQVLQFGSVTLDLGERQILKDGKPVPLTPKAFDLLAVLASNPGRLLTKDDLLQAVWGDVVVEESNLAYNISAIRKALGESGESERYIETVPKRGYRFVAQLTRSGRNDSGHSPVAEMAPSALADGGNDARAADSPGSGNKVEGRQDPSPAVSSASGRRWQRVLAVCGVLCAVVAAMAAAFLWRRPVAPPDAVRFQIPLQGRLAESGTFKVSPDGRHLAFAAEGTDGIMRLWVRSMNALPPFPLPGTDGFTIFPPVFWSPDSRQILFNAGDVLKKVDLMGGAPQRLCDLPAVAVGGSWIDEGSLLLGNPAGGLVRCDVSTGATSVVTVPDPMEAHAFPVILSDGHHFFYLRISRTHPDQSGIYISDLDRPSDRTRLITTGFQASFVRATDGGLGWIVYGLNGMVFAQRFDEGRLVLRGDPVRVAAPVGSFFDGHAFSVSESTLVFRAPEPAFQLTWFDRNGREVERVGKPDRYVGLALSPEGDRVLVARHAPQSTVDQDLWLFDVSRDARPRRVTSEPTLEFWPIWVTNDRFVFGSGSEPGVYERTVGGERQLVFKTDVSEMPTSVTPDSQVLLYSRPGTKTRSDVWVRRSDSPSGRPLIQREFDQWQAQLSPNRRWVAYVSNEAGPNEVYVAEFRLGATTDAPTVGESHPVSSGGGFAPRWRADGRELFYLTPDGSVMAVETKPDDALQRGAPPRRLFQVPGVVPEWGVSKDGNRFLFAVPVTPRPPFDVIQNWQHAVNERDGR